MESRPRMKDADKFNHLFNIFLDELLHRIDRGCSFDQKECRKLDLLSLVQSSCTYQVQDGTSYKVSYEQILKENFMISFYDYYSQENYSIQQRILLRNELDLALKALKDSFLISASMKSDLNILHKKAKLYFKISDFNIDRFNDFSSFLQIISAGMIAFIIHKKLNYVGGIEAIVLMAITYLSLSPLFDFIKTHAISRSSQEKISSYLTPIITPNSPSPSSPREFASIGTQTALSLTLSSKEHAIHLKEAIEFKDSPSNSYRKKL